MSSDENLVAGIIDPQQEDKSYVHKKNSISNQGKDPSQEEYERHNITIHISTIHPKIRYITTKKNSKHFLQTQQQKHQLIRTQCRRHQRKRTNSKPNKHEIQ